MFSTQYTKYLTVLTLLLLFSMVYSQESNGEPEWVKNQTVENADEYYYGIGISSESSEVADARAYLRIAEHIGVSVKSEQKHTIKENLLGILDFWSQSSSVVTEEEVSGIPISAQWHDSAVYYSLVKIQKDEYLISQKRALDQDAAINASKLHSDAKLEKARVLTEAEVEAAKIDADTRLAKAKAENKKTKKAAKNQDSWINSSVDNVNAEIQNKISKFEAIERKRITKEARRIKKMTRVNTHRRFSSMTPPRSLISFQNAQLIRKSHHFSLGLGVDPFSISAASYTYHIWYVETSLKLKFINNKLQWQDVSIKMQVLPLTEGYYRTSIGIGVVEYLSQISETDTELLQPKYSPVVYGNIAIPHLVSSHLSFYGDYRKISFGLNSFVFFNSTQDRFNFVTQIDIILDENYQTRFRDSAIFSAGFQFKPIDDLTTTISYEDHEIFVLRFEYEM